MTTRKRRIPVVFDTNVILWRDQRQLQLILSDDVVREYLDVLSRLNVPEALIKRLEGRLARRITVTHVSLGARPKLSRDPDDNLMIATARSGKAKFLVTNDRDLLDISAAEQARLRLRIIRPQQLLSWMRSG